MSASRPESEQIDGSAEYESALKFTKLQYHRSAYAAHEFFAKQKEMQKTFAEDINGAFNLLLADRLPPEEKKGIAKLQEQFLSLQPTLMKNPFDTPERLRVDTFIPHPTDGIFLNTFIKAICDPCKDNTHWSALLSATSKFKKEINDPSLLLLTAMQIKYQNQTIQSLATELIKPQQNMARYELLLKSLKDPLEDIIKKINSAVENLEKSDWPEKNNAIIDLVKRKRSAEKSLAEVETTYLAMKERITQYNNDLEKPSSQAVQIQTLLASLSAEKNRLLRSEKSSPHNRVRLEAITRMTEAIIENLVTPQDIQETTANIAHKINQIKQDAEFKEAIRYKEPAGILSFLSRTPRKETKLWVALENFHHNTKLRGPESAPAIMEKPMPPKSSTSSIGVVIGLSPDIVGMDEIKNSIKPKTEEAVSVPPPKITTPELEDDSSHKPRR